ncbi:MAG TPA: protein kinase [Candidatus Krumholzibacteria bacterium]|nr:protein kinase [Candidatus Krumholzibacteria bacterium]
MTPENLAHYELSSLLGKGGMGEVYRARDTKLGREVAIKVLPREMSGDPERLARFDREARTLATLQHPNIASIYGFETEGNTRFLVMELVEGEDLSERLSRGPIAPEETIELGIQMAEGLSAAHAVGVIHRDLKPANFKISPEGKLKILDFGLARAYTEDSGSDSNLANSPTLTAMTQAGVLLGTAAYMAPEQARGKRADHRADIWSFGVVLFEMLTGERLFEGETVSDTLAGVLRAELPWDRLPKGTPHSLRRLLKRCLERDLSRRLQAIAEARIVLEDLKTGGDEPAPEQSSIQSGARFTRERLLWIVALLALLAVVGVLSIDREKAAPPPLVQSTLMPPRGWNFSPSSPFAVSPDETQVAFVAVAVPDNDAVPTGTTSLWIKEFASSQPRQLVGTDDASYPFWSPDGRWLAFSANAKLNKIEARGGPVIPLCDGVKSGRGGTWNDKGVIVFQRAWNEPLMRVSASGGKPEPLTTLQTDRLEIAHRWPRFLPDGNHFLYYIVCTANPGTSEGSGLAIGSLDGKSPKFLLQSESRALYARGSLLYRAGRNLMARPFDASALKFTGEPIAVATDIPGGSVSWGGAQFSVSRNTLVHMRGAGAAQTLLRWRDRTGAVLETLGDPSGYWELNLSHDGTRLAFSMGQDSGDIWILDLQSGMRTRFTFDPADDRCPLWSPDDSQLAFMSTREGKNGIYLRPTSGQGEASLVFADSTNIYLTDWSSDGRWIFFSRMDADRGSEVLMLDAQNKQVKTVLSNKGFNDGATLSPDGKWLAFVSGKSGKVEVYVQSFPDAKGQWLISTDGGPSPCVHPRWDGKGREIFYVRGAAVEAVPVSLASSFSFGEPKTLFNLSSSSADVTFEVARDGQKILTNELPPADKNSIGATLIQNWPALLSR